MGTFVRPTVKLPMPLCFLTTEKVLGMEIGDAIFTDYAIPTRFKQLPLPRTGYVAGYYTVFGITMCTALISIGT